MTKAAKYLHITKSYRAGSFNGFSLCGRMVNRMSLVGEQDATCTKCLAESLARSSQKVGA